MKDDFGYRTRDLAESAALIVSSQKLTDIVKEGDICWFVFSNSKECQRLSKEYFFGQLQVNAREFKEAMDLLKNRIFAKN